MPQKPREFDGFPVRYDDAQRENCLRAVVQKNHDGDTPTLLCDDGDWNYKSRDIRVDALWCPELDEPGGVEAQRGATGVLWIGRQVLVRLLRTPVSDVEDRSLLRYVGRVYTGIESGRRDSYAAQMIAAGFGTATRPA